MHILEELLRNLAADDRIHALPLIANTEPSLGGRCMSIAQLFHTALISAGVDAAYDFFAFAYDTLKAFDRYDDLDPDVVHYIKDKVALPSSDYLGACLCASDNVPDALATLCAVLIHCLRCTTSTINAFAE